MLERLCLVLLLFAGSLSLTGCGSQQAETAVEEKPVTAEEVLADPAQQEAMKGAAQ